MTNPLSLRSSCSRESRDRLFDGHGQGADDESSGATVPAPGRAMTMVRGVTITMDGGEATLVLWHFDDVGEALKAAQDMGFAAHQPSRGRGGDHLPRPPRARRSGHGGPMMTRRSLSLPRRRSSARAGSARRPGNAVPGTGDQCERMRGGRGHELAARGVALRLNVGPNDRGPDNTGSRSRWTSRVNGTATARTGRHGSRSAIRKANCGSDRGQPETLRRSGSREAASSYRATPTAYPGSPDISDEITLAQADEGKLRGSRKAGWTTCKRTACS